MGRETCYELARRSIPVTRNDGTHLSWCDSVLSVRTDKGMNFFEFSYNLECLDKGLDLFEYSVPSPKSSPAKSLCKSKFINNEMPNYDYTEMLVDSSFWPHNNALTQEMTNLVMSTWSPPHFFENRSVLAMLNNIGGVLFITQQLYQWKTVLDLSAHIQDCLEHNRSPKNFLELKESAYIVESCSICWAPQLNKDQSCYFVTAQKNGTILFWNIFNNMGTPALIAKLESGMSEIRNMYWIPKTDTMIWLICADIMGQVNVFEIQLENGNMRLLQSHMLWEHRDRMIATYLNYKVIDESIVIFYSKHRHLVMQALDKSCNVLSQYIKNINDYRITDIKKSLDGYYLCTINVQIFKLGIRFPQGSLNVDLIPVDLKEPYSTYELYNLSFSNTDSIFALGMIDRRLLCRKEVLKIEVLFLSNDNKLDSLVSVLLKNPTRKLTNYWDCTEALRYRIIKTKTMPNMDCNLLYAEGSNDIYKLKIYLTLLILYLNKRKMALIGFECTLPELSVDAVKEKILLLHAQSTINLLYKKYQKNGKLNKLEKETGFGCMNYIEFYSKKHKIDIDIDKNTLGVVKKNNFEYICQSCDSKLTNGFICNSGHVNMYCMLSFTPITSDDYLSCKSCGSTARTDLCVKDYLCVFCDQPLINLD